MINRKKQKKIIIGILLSIFIIISYTVVCIVQVNHKRNREESVNKEEEILLSEAKKEEIEQFANKVVDQYPIEGHAMVVIESELISHDQYKRYLIEVNTVAISQGHSTDLYTYYVVIQENQEDQFYVLPFGVEVIKGNEDHLKREIMISMMKVVNGWGNSSEEFEDRWSKALLIPKNRAQIIKNKGENNEIDLNKIYYTQAVLKYMNDYLSAYKEAVESSDFNYIKPFLIEDERYSKRQYQELEKLKEQNITREVINSLVIGITLADNNQECLVITQVDMNTYLSDGMVRSSQRVTHKVGMRNREVQILDVLEIESKK